jgi:hypothetical protein
MSYSCQLLRCVQYSEKKTNVKGGGFAGDSLSELLLLDFSVGRVSDSAGRSLPSAFTSPARVPS